MRGHRLYRARAIGAVQRGEVAEEIRLDAGVDEALRLSASTLVIRSVKEDVEVAWTNRSRGTSHGSPAQVGARRQGIGICMRSPLGARQRHGSGSRAPVR